MKTINAIIFQIFLSVLLCFFLEGVKAQSLVLESVNTSSMDSYDGTITAIFDESSIFPPYSFIWKNSMDEVVHQDFVYTGNTSVFNNVGEGDYSVTVVTSDNCLSQKSIGVCADNGALTANIVDALEMGQWIERGSVDLQINTNEENPIIEWTGPDGFTASTEDISDLSPGVYNATVLTSYGCTYTYEAIVILCSFFSEGLEVQSFIQPTHTCLKNGFIDITIPDGTPPIRYNWEGENSFSSSSEDIYGLSAGFYLLTVTDFECKRKFKVFEVESIGEPVEIYSGSTNSVCLENSGRIDISVLGEEPFSYQWNNGATSQNLINITSGIYCVTVTDINGCTTEDCFSVIAPDPDFSMIEEAVVKNNCYSSGGFYNGSITITHADSPNSHQFEWSNGETSNVIGELAPGSYTVTVSAYGCEEVFTYEILESPELAILSEPSNSCRYQGTGSIDITVSGGVPPYDYEWTNSSTSEDITNLWYGLYGVTVTDAAGCSKVRSTYVNSHPVMIISGNLTECGFTNSEIDVTIEGGNPPYSYSWSNGDSSEDILGLTYGEYTLTVTDALGCYQIKTFELDSPLYLVAPTVATCPGYSAGAVLIGSVVGGASPYQFLWDNGGTSQYNTNLGPGTHTVTITDAAGCQSAFDFVVGNDMEPEKILQGLTPPYNCRKSVWCNGIPQGVEYLTTAYVFGWRGKAGTCTGTRCVNGEYESSAMLDVIDIVAVGDPCDPCQYYATCPYATFPTYNNGGAPYLRARRKTQKQISNEDLCFKDCTKKVRCKINSLTWYETKGSNSCRDVAIVGTDPTGIKARGGDGGKEYYVIGNYTYSNGTTSAFLIRNDSLYNPKWEIPWIVSSNGSSYANEMVTDTEESIITVGRYSDTLMVELDTTLYIPSNGGDDVFIAKDDNDGFSIWAKQLGGAGNDSANGIATDSEDNLFVVGEISGLVNFSGTDVVTIGSGGFVVKYSSEGEQQWVQSIDSDFDDSLFGVEVDDQNNIFLVGYKSTPSGQKNLYIAKLNVFGDVLWEYDASFNANFIDGNIIIDSDGNPVVAATFMDQSLKVKTELVKLGEELGNTLWNVTLENSTGGIDGASIENDESSGFYLAGNFEGSFNLFTTSINSSFENDIFIAKFNSGGDLEEIKQEGAVGNSKCKDIAFLDGKISYTGSFIGLADTIEGIPFTGYEDISTMYLVGYNDRESSERESNGSKKETNLEVSGIEIKKIYPNPFTNKINIELIGDEDGQVKIELFNTLGNKIHFESRSIVQGANVVQVTLSGEFSKGVYEIRITDIKGKLNCQKLIKL